MTAGVGDFDDRSAQDDMHVEPNNEVLAETAFGGAHAPWIEGHRMPVARKRRRGRGRVFRGAPGHVAAELVAPEMATILERGLPWAARPMG